MLFSIHCLDRAGQLQTRTAARAEHLDYLTGLAGQVVHAGPLLTDDGQPCGSLLVVEAADRGGAEALAANDPYARAGLFESVTIHAHRVVFRDGARVG